MSESASATPSSRVRARSSRPGVGPRGRGAPRRRSGRSPGRARVRWDRIGRIALVAVLGIVGILYIQHAVAYFNARSQFDAQGSLVRNLEQANAALVREQRSLHDPATIMRHARALGMVRPGERSYVITGTPAGQ